MTEHPAAASASLHIPALAEAILARRNWGILIAVLMVLSLLTVRQACAQSGGANDDSRSVFDVLEFQVEGNSLLTDMEIMRAVTPFLGEHKSIREVEAARVALEEAYRDAGYRSVVVSIPEQQVDDGLVVLSVLEGKVERLRTRGAEYHSSSRIKAQVPEFAEGSVPYFPAVQRDLDAINSGADLKVTPVLKAGRLPGTIDVSLDVEDQLPVHGAAEITNRSTPYTDELRTSLSLRYDNLWQRRHSMGVSAQLSPTAPEQYRTLAGNYVLPLGLGGTALALYMVRARTNVPSYPTAALGNTNVAGFRLVLPLTTVVQYSHSLSVGVDHKSIRQQTVLGGPGGPSLSQPAFSYSPIIAVYNGTWTGTASTTSVDATATIGVRGIMGNDEASFGAKRVGASADFVAMKIGARQIWKLGRWSASARLDGQFASGPLVPNEQYAAGGAESVRGYRESERLGDDAIHMSFELRTPSLALPGGAADYRLTGLGFADGARLRVREAVFPQVTYYVLRGGGLGIRLTGPRGFNAELDWARALDDAQVTRAGGNRIHARFAWDF